MFVTHPRMALALRAGTVTFLFAVALVLLWFLLYGVRLPDQELVGLAIWTPLMGVFTALWVLTLAGFLERGRRFTVALIVGALGGLVWFVVATIPKGLWLAWLDLPVYVIWPLAAAVGVAAVAPRPGRGVRGEASPWLPVLYGLTGLAAFTFLLKMAPSSWLGPDAELPRRTLGSVADPPPSSAPDSALLRVPELGGGGAPVTPPCHDPAPRPLPLDPVVVDSSSVARPRGTFTDRREREVGGVRHVYGRTLRLWSVEGSLTGMLESRAGPADDPGARGALELVRLDEITGTLTFDAYFEDGFVSRFRGALDEASVEGVLETMDADCLTRVLSTDTVVLRREDGPALPGESPTFRAVASRLVASGAFRRERRRLEGVIGRGSVAVEGDRWRGPGTSGVSFSARFAGRAEAAAALDPGRAVSVRGRSVPLRDLLYAVRIDGSGYAEWLLVGPTEVLDAYRMEFFAGARERGATEPKSRVVRVVPCC